MPRGTLPRINHPMTTSFRERIRTGYAHVSEHHGTYLRIVRFIVSGAIATSVNLGSIFVFTHYFDIWYLYSSVIAFGIAFGISFVLQKIWTFQDRSSEHVHTQAALFLFIIILGLGLNTLLLYGLVEFLGIHYLAGQLLSGVCIAVFNFFSYKHVVFIRRGDAPLPPEQHS